MCVHKIKILNKGYNPLDTLSTKYIEVNCGKCWQCKLQRSNDFAFRIFAELYGGFYIPFFVTLTYNDDYLPILTYKDNHNFLHEISVWNRVHLQNFHKVIRRQLQYYYGLPSNSFKYLLTCERGSDRQYVSDSGKLRTATKRPHYHAIYLLNTDKVIVPVRPLPYDFFVYCRAHSYQPDFTSFFRYLLNSRWIYGNVDDIYFCRDIVACVRYVCKYILKDYGDNIFNIKPYDCYGLRDKQFNDCQSAFLAHTSKFLPKPIKLTSLLPRSISSINLGFSWVHNKSVDELINYMVGNSKVVLPSVRSSSLVNLPNYYYRKLCYFSKKLHLDRFYPQNLNSSAGLVRGYIFTSERVHVSEVWDNIHGYFKDCKVSPYIRRYISQLGLNVRRVRFVESFKKIKLFYKNVCRDFSFYRDLYDKFFDIPICERNSISYPSSSFVTSLENSPKVFNLRDFLLYKRCLCNFQFVELFNFMNVCTFTISHLRHLSFDKNYRKNLNSVAFDNPDLFLTHLI